VTFLNAQAGRSTLGSVLIVLLVVIWFYSAWQGTSAVQITTYLVPATADSTDDTTELLSEAETQDTAVNPDTLSAVAAGDGVTTVDKGKIMYLTSFASTTVPRIPVNANIVSATLEVRFGGENGYAPATGKIRYNNGAGLTNTTITPYDISGFEATTTNLVTLGVDTADELRNLDIEFTSSDTGGADAVHFDYVRLNVVYEVPTLEQSAFRFFEPNNGLGVGDNPLAGNNATTTIPTAQGQFRLRALLHVGTATSTVGTQDYVLQYAQMSGTCDSSYSGETYADVTDTTDIAFYDNAGPTSGQTLTSTTTDPTHSSDNKVSQMYTESNYATTTAQIAPGKDGLWDFSLVASSSAPAGTTYCLRLLGANGDQRTWTLVGGDAVNSSWADSTYEQVASLAVHNSLLYAGLGVGANDDEVWEWTSANDWTLVGGDAVNSSWSGNKIVSSLVSHGGKLYAGLESSSALGTGEVWEWTSANDWTLVGGDAVNSSWADSTYEAVLDLAVHNSLLYAGLGTGTGDAEVWEWTSANDWTLVGGDAVNSSWADATYEYVTALTPYNSKLYAGLGLTAGDAEVWEWTSANDWTLVGGDAVNSSWADSTYEYVEALFVFNSKLYASLGNGSGDGEVWEYNGTSWTKIGGDGVNSSWNNNSGSVSSLSSNNGRLYAGVTNSSEGEVWEYDSMRWRLVGGNSAGSSWGAEKSGVTSLVSFNSELYGGLRGTAGNAEVSKLDYSATSTATSSNTKIAVVTTYQAPTISQAYNMVFDYQGVASSTATLTITDVVGGIIRSRQGLRIPIVTSSVNMLWDTTDTQAIFGGTASGTEVTNSVVSYEGGGSVLVVPVADDFDAGDTLTISGLSFTSFNTATSSTPAALGIFADGATDITMNATTTGTVAIRGTLVLADHGSSQVSDQWDTLTPTTTTHYRFKFTGAGEEILVASTTFNLSSITGVSTADITSAKLYVDLNSNGVKDSADAIATSTKDAQLRPNAAGTFAQFTVSGCAANWDCVDEDTSDESSTRVYLLEAASEANATDSYNLPNPTGRTEVITNVKVTVRASQNNVTGGIRPLVVIGGAVYKATATSTPTASYTNFSYDWATDPSDASAWTWSDINSLEAGAYSSLPLDAAPSGAMNITQVWVEVAYEIPDGKVDISGTSGSIAFATSTPYRVGGAKNYLMYFTAANLASGDTITISLPATNSTTTGTTSLEVITPSGSATNITHTFEASGNTAPAISPVTFNGGNPINLNEGTYKWATSSFLITDAEYCTSITSVTAKAYVASSSNNGTLCSENDLNCYIGVGSSTVPAMCVATTTGNSCGASDTTVEYDCGFKFWYIARPTDTGDWATSIWSVSATVTDDGALTGTATNTSQLVDVNSLSALSLSPASLNYGNISPGNDSGLTNSTTTITNTGNTAMDPRISGTDMNSASDSILVGQQEYASNPFLWSTGTDLTTSATALDLTLPAPTATTSAITDDISWGLGVPSGKKSGSYSGSNTIDAGSAI